MKPVTLMRLRKLASPDDLLDRYSPDDLVVQPKFDGHLALVGTNEDGSIEIRSRRGNEVTERTPTIVKAFHDVLPPDTWLLGELVYVTPEGIMDLHGLQSIMKSKGKPDAGDGEVRFFVFDLLRLDGQPYEPYPYRERMQRAGAFVRRAGHPVYEAGMYTYAELPEVITESLAMGGEGAVIKLADAPYKLRPFGQAEAFGDQWKYKPPEKAQTADVILTDYTKGKAKRIFTAKQYKDGKLVEVGKLSGLDRKNEDHVAARIDAGDVVIAEVSYQERLKSGKLRHMGWSRLREDKPVQSVTFEENTDMAKAKTKPKKTKANPKAKKAPKKASAPKGPKKAPKAPKKGPKAPKKGSAKKAPKRKANPEKGDMTQARAFIMDCVGRAHVEDGQALAKTTCVEAYKAAGGIKKDGNAACKQLKDDGLIEIRKGKCHLTPKGIMHFVQSVARGKQFDAEMKEIHSNMGIDPNKLVAVNPGHMARRHNPSEDARTFIIASLGIDRQEEMRGWGGYHANKDDMRTLFMDERGGTASAFDQAYSDLKREGLIGADGKLTSKGARAFFEIENKADWGPYAQYNPRRRGRRNPMRVTQTDLDGRPDEIVLTDPDAMMEVRVSRVQSADIHIHDMDDPRRSMRVMSPSFDGALAAARDLTNNPRRGMPSRTRRGRLDYMTHRGDKDYHRHGHDVVPRPYMNPSTMYRQGVVDRLAGHRRKNPDEGYIESLREEAGMHEAQAEREMDALTNELKRVRPDYIHIRDHIIGIREHMKAALGATAQIVREEREDMRDYGGMAEYNRLEAMSMEFEDVIKGAK